MIAVLITAFNRKALTLRAIEAVLGQGDVRVFLVDDGSSDGTSAAVRDTFPTVELINGSGTLFWNGGMRLAWQHAIRSRPEFYLWLNDDVALRPDAIADLLALHQTYGARSIVVGRTVSVSGATTYGGYVRAPGVSRLRWRRLGKGEIDCDTMNGNCVLLPASVVEEVGINSPSFTHGMGDIDFGLRARRAGYRILQLPEPVALLDRDAAGFATPELLRGKSWSYILTHPKGLPLGEWLRFCLDHGGPLWAGNFVWAYAKLLFGGRR
jgi:GT2 family glycosyltransferase